MVEPKFYDFHWERIWCSRLCVLKLILLLFSSTRPWRRTRQAAEGYVGFELVHFRVQQGAEDLYPLYQE